MSQWRWTLVEEWRNGHIHTEQHSGQQPDLRDAMNDVANTVEYLLEAKEEYKTQSSEVSGDPTTVNRLVAGSNPAGGVRNLRRSNQGASNG